MIWHPDVPGGYGGFFLGKASLGGECKGITGSLKAGIMFFRNLKIEMVQAFREYGKASVFINFYFVIDLFTDYAYTVNGRYSHTSQRCVSGSVFYMGRKHK